MGRVVRYLDSGPSARKVGANDSESLILHRHGQNVWGIADGLLDILMDWKKKIGDSGWIFPSPRTAGPRSGSMLLQKGLKPIAAKHGVPGLTWHALRHACRAWLSSGGATLTTQKGLLRHADESTTSDVYGYPMTDDMRKAHDNLVSQLLEE